MIALLSRLFRNNDCSARRTIGVRPSTALSLERLEDRATPTTLTLPAFIGLTIADSHFIPPEPVAPAQFNAPVFALNYQTPPNPCTPLQALIGAFDQIPPNPVHSPVFFGVETFLSGGGATT